ncbi:MAG: hypothetical protein Q8K30_00980 [Candidatus Gracilibacteria bacterium]|nr:hypothetical protein [Candidatus Gracilibacteria bacterium]
MNNINNFTSPVNNKNESTSYSIGDEVDSILGLKKDDNVLEKYLNNQNVVLCKRELSNLLNSSNGLILKNGVSEIISNLLTNRPEYSKIKLESSDENFLINLKQKIELQSIWYKSTIDRLEAEVVKIADLEIATNPGWFSIKQKSESKEKKANYKLYLTIPVKEYSFVSNLLDLSQKLAILGNETNDNISIKVAYNMLGFVTHSDSIVVHFKNLDNKTKIEKILSDWMSYYSINEESRNLGRTKFAADSKDTSYSNIIATNIENWLKQHYGKYDNKLLVDLAIKYAIESGQKVPKINGITY